MLNTCLSPGLADLDPFSGLSIGYVMVIHSVYTPMHSELTFEMNQLGLLWFGSEETHPNRQYLRYNIGFASLHTPSAS